MTFEDVARLRIEILGDDAKKDIDGLSKAAKNVKDDLHLMEMAGEKGSAAWLELKKLQRDTNAELREQRKQVDINNASFNELLGLKKSLSQELKKTKIGSEEWIAAIAKIEPVNAKLKEAGDAIRGTADEASKTKGVWENVKGYIAGAFAVTAIIAFGKKMIDFGKQVFDLTAKFETYNTVLKNTLGGQEEASAAMQMIKDIAANTPMSVDEMTDSYIRLVNRGIKPSKQEIIQMADLAASQNKTINQLSEAIIDAMMGEQERLKEFGIRLRKDGDNVRLSFKGQVTEVKNSEDAIYDAIVAMGAYNGVAGMTSEISQTLGGRVSNLGDAWDFVRISIGEKLRPVFVGIIQLFEKGVGVVQFISDHLNRLGAIVKAVGAAIITYTIATRASAAADVASNAVKKIQQILLGQTLLAKQALTTKTITLTETEIAATVAAKGFNAALKANPIGLIITAITLAVTAFQAYQMVAEESRKEQEELNKKIADAQAPLAEEKMGFDKLTEAVLNANLHTDYRLEALAALKKQYPDQLAGISNLETAERLLGGVIADVNNDFLIRHKLLENEVRLTVEREKFDVSLRKQIELEKELTTASKERITMVTGTAGLVQTYKSEAELIKDKIALQQKEVAGHQNAMDKIASSSVQLTKSLKYEYEERASGVNMYGKLATSTEEEITTTNKKELAKRSKEKEKAAKDEKALKEKAEKEAEKFAAEEAKRIIALDKLWADSIADETDRHIAMLMQKYEADSEYLDNNIKDAKEHGAALVLLKAKLILEIDKLEEKERLANEKARAEELKKEMEWSRQMEDWTLDHMQKSLEDQLELTEEFSSESLRIQKELIDLKHRRELVAIKRWGEDQLSNTELTEEQRDFVLGEVRMRREEADRSHEIAKVNFIKDQTNRLHTWIADRMSKMTEEQKAMVVQAANSAQQVLGQLWGSLKDGMADDTKIIAEGFQNVLTNIASGNIVGTIWSVLEIPFKLNQNMKAEQKRIAEWQAQLIKEELTKAYTEIIQGFGDGVDRDKIGEIYTSLVSAQDSWLTSIMEFDFNYAENYEARINDEIKFGEQIVANYAKAVEAEKSYSAERINNINELYNLELRRINEKYERLNIEGRAAFDAETQAIKQNLSDQLLALVSNEDSKTSVTEEYAERRSQIFQTFARADQVITEDTDQATINAINAQIDARNKALVDLQNWYNSELNVIINSEEQKRKEYSETELIQKEAQDALALLALEYQAKQIELDLQKNAEILIAEQEKNNALELETERYNDVVLKLGIDKDVALAKSFENLKAIYVAGYDAIIAKAREAYAAGAITADQLNEVIQNLSKLGNQLGLYSNYNGGWVDVNNNPYVAPVDYTQIPDFTIPGFRNGGIIPNGPSHESGGITLWDNMSGRAIAEIEGGEPILSREVYRNNKQLVDALLSSSVHKNGAKISAGGSHFNYASPHYGNGGMLPNAAASNVFGSAKDGVFAQFLDSLNATNSEISKMRSENNRLLSLLVKKPGGVSLHDLNDAASMQDLTRRISDF